MKLKSTRKGTTWIENENEKILKLIMIEREKFLIRKFCFQFSSC